MSREDGFEIADVSVAKLSDPKFKKLWRLVQDEQVMNACAVLHDATLLASWQHGERVVAEDAAPAWMTDIDTAAEWLIKVELFDAERRIPEQAFIHWFGPAWERREAQRARWRRENDRRRGKASDSGDGAGAAAVTPRKPRGHHADTAAPVRPSVPSVPSVHTEPSSPRAAARGSTGLSPIGETIRGWRDRLVPQPTSEGGKS